MPLLEVTKPAGPFAVGQCDCMWLDAAPAQRAPGAQSADDGVPVPKHKLMLRIYYPVEPDVAAQHAEASWLPNDYGVRSYAEAYADAMFKGVGGTLVGTLGFGPLMKNVKSQTVEGAPLASAPTKAPNGAATRIKLSASGVSSSRARKSSSIQGSDAPTAPFAMKTKTPANSHCKM